MWIVIGLVAAFLIWWIFRVQRLNGDPVQRQIAEMIVELAIGGFPGQLESRLIRDSSALSLGARGPKLSTRLPHALSMARNRLTPQQYEKAKDIVRNISMAASQLGD